MSPASETQTVPHHHSHGPANRRRRVLETAAPLYLAEPAGPIRGAVVVLHDIFGLTEYIEQYCLSLARRGWLAVAPYHYYDAGGRESPDLATARMSLRQLSAQSLRADVDGAVDYLHARRGMTAGSISVLGFSMGGYLAAWANTRHDLAAAVSVSPSRPDAAPMSGMPALGEVASHGRAKWLAVLGEQDDHLSTSDVEALRALDTATVRVVVHGEHGFFRDHRGHAASQGWRTIERFLMDPLTN